MRSDCSPSLVPEGRGQQEEIGLGSKHKAYRGDSPPLLPQLLPGLFLQKDPCQGLAKEKKVKKKKKRYTFCTQLTTKKKGQNPTH